MNFAPFINTLISTLSANSRVCTRYNSPSSSAVIDKIAIHERQCRVDVVDYCNYPSFVIKAIQIQPEDIIVANDSLDVISSKMVEEFSKANSFKMFDCYTDALKYSGMRSSYLWPLRNIEVIIHKAMSKDKDRADSVITFGASSGFTNSLVSMIFKIDGCIVTLQFKEH